MTDKTLQDELAKSGAEPLLPIEKKVSTKKMMRKLLASPIAGLSFCTMSAGP